MEILLISESDTIFQQTQRILEEQKKLSLFSFEDIKQTDNLQYDIIIIDFDQLRVCKKDFKIILDIKCRSNIPILALLEKSSVPDQFEVLSMGALDFLECPATDEVYSGKLEQLYQWKWYYDWEKNMHENTIS